MRIMTTTLLLAALGSGALHAAQEREPLRLRGPDLDIDLALEDVRAGIAAIGPSLEAASRSIKLTRIDLGRTASTLRFGLGSGLGIRSATFRRTPPEPWAVQDPADSLYRAGRQALNRNDYSGAAEFFRQIRNRFPRSEYTPDAYYWEAFALYRRGGSSDLGTAVTLLDQQADRHPQAATSGDGSALLTRVLGELARQGDAEASRRIDRTAREAVGPSRTGVGRRASRGDSCDGADGGVQSAALNALLQMDSERAIPILRRVLERRDEGSVCLRRRAVFMLSQHETPETSSLLLNVAKTDPDLEVRRRAVFWLSQVEGDAAVAALEEVLSSTTDPNLQERAVFALSQHESARAQSALRSYASRTDIPKEIREKAVFWIGQGDTPENATFLKELFRRSNDNALKERVLFSVSQMDRGDAGRWLVDIAKNTGESTEIRKKALFWAGQGNALTPSDLSGLYASMNDREMKEQLIFVLSQSESRAAVDELIKIARTEKDTDLQKRAIFWLSQSDDPRVAGLLAEFLNVPARRP